MGNLDHTHSSHDDAAGGTETVVFRRNDEEHRYEAIVGDEVAGYAEFQLKEPSRIVFTHTVSEPAFAGRGIATRLVEWSLADARDQGERIVPVCPFVLRYLETHHQFDDAVERA